MRTKIDAQIIKQILDVVRGELCQDISTRKIYNRAYALLKKKNS